MYLRSKSFLKIKLYQKTTNRRYLFLKQQYVLQHFFLFYFLNFPLHQRNWLAHIATDFQQNPFTPKNFFFFPFPLLGTGCGPAYSFGTRHHCGKVRQTPEPKLYDVSSITRFGRASNSSCVLGGRLQHGSWYPTKSKFNEDNT